MIDEAEAPSNSFKALKRHMTTDLSCRVDADGRGGLPCGFFRADFFVKKLGLKRHPLPVRLEYIVLVLVVLCR